MKNIVNIISFNDDDIQGIEYILHDGNVCEIISMDIVACDKQELEERVTAAEKVKCSCQRSPKNVVIRDNSIVCDFIDKDGDTAVIKFSAPSDTLLTIEDVVCLANKTSDKIHNLKYIMNASFDKKFEKLLEISKILDA